MPQSMGLQRVRHDLVTEQWQQVVLHVFSWHLQKIPMVMLYISPGLVSKCEYLHVWLFNCRLLCPWYSLGKDTGVGSHCILQGIFLTQGSNWVSYISGRFFIINNSAGSSGLWTHTLEETGALIQHLRSPSHAIPRVLLGLWLHFCSYLLSSEPWALWGRNLAKLSFILSTIIPGTLYMVHNC